MHTDDVAYSALTHTALADMLADAAADMTITQTLIPVAYHAALKNASHSSKPHAQSLAKMVLQRQCWTAIRTTIIQCKAQDAFIAYVRDQPPPLANASKQPEAAMSLPRSVLKTPATPSRLSVVQTAPSVSPAPAALPACTLTALPSFPSVSTFSTARVPRPLPSIHILAVTSNMVLLSYHGKHVAAPKQSQAVKRKARELASLSCSAVKRITPQMHDPFANAVPVRL